MMEYLSQVVISVHPKLYVKNPETSELGRKIIQQSILLIDEIGFEAFTFKKLGERIGSNESSLYRYFENKHKLLLYLTSWYWGWMEYRLVFETNNITDAQARLLKAVELVTEKIQDDTSTVHINEAVLNNIVIVEFTKTILTKEVDQENSEGFFMVYKKVVNRLVQMITEAKPDYPFAKSLASSIIEGALHQHFLKDHLTTITDCNELQSPSAFYKNLVEQILK
ncbi:TetR/AcrR family transcriptional regulator [Flavobacterium sp. CYK-55]|uniref:TetR/AcrR family transcriptional regulator n=1 Tax=Flavobacterium sp. CYK-55 TaxID=2835529 RepID=UPI003977E27D